MDAGTCPSTTCAGRDDNASFGVGGEARAIVRLEEEDTGDDLGLFPGELNCNSEK
jgi:hypothetical protein